MRVCDPPTLEELAGWPWDEDDNPAVITEFDVHIEDEIRDEDEHVEAERRCLNYLFGHDYAVRI